MTKKELIASIRSLPWWELSDDQKLDAIDDANAADDKELAAMIADFIDQYGPIAAYN